MPDPGVAGWVSANDKPAAAPKPVSGDAAEQRVKTEVKNLPARDRRRIKTAGTADAGLDSLNGLAVKPGVIDITESQTARGLRLKRSYDEYNREKSIRLPEVTPTSAGGLLRTSKPWPSFSDQVVYYVETFRACEMFFSGLALTSFYRLGT